MRVARSLFAAVVIGAAAYPSAGAAQAPSAAPAQDVQPVQPGAPGEESRPISAAAATDVSKVQFTKADVEFMQGMIGHHAQAVEMVAMIPSRTKDPAMNALGQRIDISQQDEIKMMQDWLASRGQKVPDQHAHHAPGAPLMPGMLTPEEMARLGQATGPEFEHAVQQVAGLRAARKGEAREAAARAGLGRGFGLQQLGLAEHALGALLGQVAHQCGVAAGAPVVFDAGAEDAGLWGGSALST